MGMCEKIKTNRVIYDELISGVVVDDETISLSKYTRANPVSIDESQTEVVVSVLECDLERDPQTGYITGKITNLIIHIEKRVVINLDAGEPLILQFSFNRRIPDFMLTKFNDAYITNEDLRFAHCQVHDFVPIDSLVLIPEYRLLRETLIASFTIKISREDQMIVALCPSSTFAEITTSSN